MFKSFGKTGSTDPAQPRGTSANPTDAAAAVTATALKSLNPRDKDLTDRLELKSRLHEALLERLNLSVIDKVQTEELRREVANLAQAVLAEEKRPMRTEDFKAIVDEWEVEHIVVGLPLSLDGSVGKAAKAALREADELGVVTGVPVETYDERLTTVSAHQVLREQGVAGADRKDVVDKVAAAVLLQAWLDGRDTETNP